MKQYKTYIKPIRVGSNVKCNEDIKAICELAGITEPTTKSEVIRGVKKNFVKPKNKFITFRSSRNTFVSIARYRGMSDENIKKMTGHTNSLILQVYDKVTPEMNADKIYRDWNKVV